MGDLTGSFLKLTSDCVLLPAGNYSISYHCKKPLMILAKNLNKNNQPLMGLILLLRLFILWTVVPFQALGLPS